MKKAINTHFAFTKGAVAGRKIESCIDVLYKEYGDVGGERIVDFCICQVYAICDYGKEYLLKWQVSHSFGKKALERFKSSDRKRYFQDRWLQSYGLTREELYRTIKEPGEHPYSVFIYPEYEDKTKRRMLSSEVGYYICGVSTLLWTPFSPICIKCKSVKECMVRTEKLYPEIYRIRIEQHKGKERV